MATNSDKNLSSYFAVFDAKYADLLGNIRNWGNILMSTEDGEIWLKGFTREQMLSSKLRIIPSIILFEQKEDYLFEINNCVPSRIVNSGLLWNSMQKVINITLPFKNESQNSSPADFRIAIVASNEEFKSNALVISLEDLEQNLLSLPEFRQQELKWVVVENNVILLGTPLIGLPGATYWQNDNHFLPSGYNLEFPILSQELNYHLNAENRHFIFWNKDGGHSLIEKENFMPLSISSFRKTKMIL